MRKRNIRKTRVAAFGILSLAMCFFLTGCIPNDFSKEEQRAVTNQAKEMMQSYLDEKLPEAEITSVDTLNAVSGNTYAYQLTEYAKGTFCWQEESYDFVVNIKDGDIYTSECLETVKERLTEEITDRLGIRTIEAEPVYVTAYYLNYKKDSGLDRSAFSNVFPAGDSAEEIIEDILNEKETYAVSCAIQYKGLDIPKIVTWDEAPFASLEKLSVYHIFEDSELLVKELSDGLRLPCVSCEVLEADYEEKTGILRKNRIARRDGFCVLYNAYTEKKEGDSVTEYEIEDEDIQLAVTESYLELTCKKEGYSFWVFAENPAMAENYVYIRSRRYNLNKKPEYQKGVWCSLNGTTIFADDEKVPFPYQFDDFTKSEYGSGNRIYTETGMNEMP